MNLKRMQREAEELSEVAGNLNFDGAYFGGGTPSLYDEADFEIMLGNVFNRFKIKSLSTNTCEMHPSSTTNDKIILAKQYGINRISFGVQSATPEVLKLCGRHEQTTKQLLNVISQARRAGIGITNIDLIAMLNGETMESFKSSVETVAGMDPNSITLYRLKISPLNARRYKADGRNDPTEWNEAKELFRDIMDKFGYRSIFPNEYSAVALKEMP